MCNDSRVIHHGNTKWSGTECWQVFRFTSLHLPGEGFLTLIFTVVTLLRRLIIIGQRGKHTVDLPLAIDGEVRVVFGTRCKLLLKVETRHALVVHI
jgi:hypothetical protein